MILNSPYISGSLTVTNLSGSGVRYLMTSASGLLISQTADAAIKNTYTASATAGQTVFPVTNGYSTGLVDVYLNGTKLASSDYSDADGLNITLVTGSDAGDLLEFVKYSPALGATNNALRQLTTFTSSEGQTVYSASYTPGLLDVYYNGSRLTPAEYTANNGTYITLATGSSAGDIIDMLVYSYQVGAFSGVGGTGVTNQVAYWGTTNAITGSPNFTVSGSTLAVTGSLVVSGSGTFTNIGPAVMSGSLNVSGAITTNSTITATTLVVQTVTSSNSQISGSTKFGTLSSDTHQFTGSMSVTGGLVDINKDGQSLRIFPQTSAGSARIQLQNSGSGGLAGANAIIAVESSTGADQFTGTSPFSFVIGTATQKAFHLGANSAVVMTITGSNVGIGTSSPNSILEISSASPIIRIQASDSGTFHGIEFRQAGGFDAFIKQLPVTGEFKISSGRSVGWGGFTTFYTDTVERMRITSGGVVCMNTTTAAGTLSIKAQSDNRAIFFQNPSGGDGSLWLYGASNSFDYKFSTWSQGSAFYLYNNGNYSFAGSNVSDRRLKENIEAITYNAIEKIMQLVPKSYNMIAQPEINRNGFIAQEVKEILPDIITGNETDGEYLGLDYNGLLALTVKALQEANAKITALEEKLERNNIQ